MALSTEENTSESIRPASLKGHLRFPWEGVKGFTISAAVKNIEGWEETLKDMDAPGAKGIVRDLESLKKQLQKDEIDGEAVQKLVAKLGKETIAMAGKADSKKADQVKALGEALESMTEKAA